ncbi:MAG: FAD/NAD(P)-binding protein [Desulfobacterales bacterium]
MKHHIVIIGAGPRGTYGFRRLSIALAQNPLKNEVHIHVIEKSGKFGGGGIHSITQPHYLLLNTIASQITAFGDDDDEARASLYRKTLHGYLNKEGCHTDPNDYPPRALHGRYLAEAFDWTAENLPEKVTLHRHHADAVDISAASEGIHVVHLNNGNSIHSNEIILLTGHSKNRIIPGSVEDSCHQFAQRQRQKGKTISYLHMAYPIAEKLQYIQSDESVYVIGMGLTAVDIIKGFTYGRGGAFKDGEYIPSGKEPHIIIGSRIGLPYCARGLNQKTEQYQGKIFTRDYVLRLKQKNRKLDFEKDLFPMILQEMEYVFYKTLIGNTFAEQYLCCKNASDRQALVEKNIEVKNRFCWQDLENPLWRFETQRKPEQPLFESMEHYSGFVLEQIQNDIKEAQKGNMAGPLKNAIDSVMRDLRDNLRSAVDHGGLTAKSHRYLKRVFDRTNNRIAVGPPIQSVKELLILAKQGIVSFSGPSPRIDFNENDSMFEVSSDEVPGSKRQVHHVINGRIHSVDNQNDTSPLIRNLFKRHMVRVYVNADETDKFEMGGLDITPDFQLIAKNGIAHRHICALGIPLEGKLWFNAADARPDVNSNAITQLSTWAQGAVSRLHDREQVF